MKISYSDLESYKSCPRKFKFKRDRAPYNDSGDLALRFGSAVHNALKVAYSSALISQPLAMVLAAYYKSWPEAARDEVTAAEKQSFLRGVTAIKEYLDKEPPHKARVAAVEKMIRLNFAGHTLVGRFDRVDVLGENYFEVIDYKTGKLPSAANLAENWQLAIYQQAVGEMFQVPRVKTSLVYIMFGGHKLSHEFHQDELAQIKYDIINTITEIERDQDFHPRPSGLCNRCGYAAICPAMRHQTLRQLGQLGQPGQPMGTVALPNAASAAAAETTFADIQKVIDEFIKLRAEIKQLKGKLDQYKLILAEYMAKEDLTRLFSDVGEVNQAMIKVTSYDPGAVAQILAGTDHWLEVISVSTSKLKALLPKLPLAQQAALKAAATITEKAQLRVKAGIKEEV